MEQFTAIGYTKKARGIDGTLKIFVKDQFQDAFLEAEVLFVELKGGKVPFFIEQITEGADMLVKFEEIDDRQAAVELTGKPVFLRQEDLSDETGDPDGMDFHFLEGFEIISGQEGRIGIISAIIEMPQQLMAIVDYRGKEVLIPLNDQFITGVDENRRILEMELPDGLLDL